MFGLSALATKAIIAAVLAAVFVAGWLWVTTHYYNKGWNAHAAAVAAQDRRAIDASNAARKKVDDCFNAGGNWDDSRGVCDK